MREPEDFILYLAARELAAIRRAGISRTFPAGYVLASQGRLPESAVVIESGWVKSLHVSSQGQRALLDFSGRGALAGEQAALLNVVHASSIVAVCPGQALFVPRDRFARLLWERPNLGKCVQLASLVRQRSTEHHLTQICALPPEQRLSHCLMNLGRRYGRPGDDSHDLGIPITQQDLADWTGVSRETVERILRSWRRRGLVETRRRGVVILQPPGLRSLAGVLPTP
ncbi:Crp/Fnr family transcriptional regulator [Nonomuraea fuscirosea]|uniref:Crp/Fnr family transcriptional regulator n=1 Tax=Nonomuraea fuscirosea TaxID=1291556 RepID=UPI0033F7F3E0